ncbi:MAG: alpha/beta hydrolase [Chloroflexi bacterium]|nr:alpha/beta hydrolase [Chloroflexota bacterium]MDL1882061.1 alpha/beta hydrolase [Anaerolineae bacterium CFX8]
MKQEPLPKSLPVNGEGLQKTRGNQPPITTLDVKGISTAQIVHGEGPPVVLLHGWGAHSGLMWPLVERLAPLGYRCYVPDLPGFGQTPPPPEAWSVFDYAAWVLALLEANGLERVHLFGHSFGGRLGLILGAEHPERLVKMVLADSAGVRPKPSTTGSLRLKVYRAALNALRGAGLQAQAERLRGWYGSRYGSADYKAAAGVMRETFVKVVNEDLLPYAARVKVSTLLFWGDRDADTPLEQGRLLERTIPDAGLVVWEGAGHYSYLERAADTARVMDHFFRQ